MKYLMVTDIPTPWRETVHEIVHHRLGDDFHVVYCKDNEKKRLWTFRHGNHPKTLLKALTFKFRGTERFLNVGIFPFILRHRPSVVVCFALDPTIILAFLASKIIRAKIVFLYDSWAGRELGINLLQKTARKVTFTRVVDVFIGASKQTLELYKHYNPKLNPDSLFLSWLCADNDFFLKAMQENPQPRDYDIMFSGRIVKLKNPAFFARIAIEVKKKIGHCRVLIIGDGDPDLKNQMFQELREGDVDFTYEGFVKHERLPELYCRAKLLLLPTSMDCWGVVINEAMVSGTPVITTAMTAAAGELVKHGVNGLVLPMKEDEWVAHTASLLSDPEKLTVMADAARKDVASFTFENAAEGMIGAIEYAEKLGKTGRNCNRRKLSSPNRCLTMLLHEPSSRSDRE